MKLISFITIIILLIIAGCQKELSCEDCDTLMNIPPVANAGADQSFNPHLLDSCILNGSLSFDPDGDIASYSWKVIDHPFPAQIVSETSVETGVTGLSKDGTYKFELTVTDNGGLSAKDTVNVNVLNAASNSFRFDSLFAIASPSPCVIQIPDIYSYVPENDSFSVYVSAYWYAGAIFQYSPWFKIDTIPPPVNPSSPLNPHDYWYQVENGVLKIYAPRWIDCNFDATLHDILIKWN